MKMAMKDGKIMLIEVDNTQMAIIKSWNSMKYDRRKNMMIGDCSKELLDKLSKIVRLPPAIESYRQRFYLKWDAARPELRSPSQEPHMKKARSRESW